MSIRNGTTDEHKKSTDWAGCQGGCHCFFFVFFFCFLFFVVFFFLFFFFFFFVGGGGVGINELPV